MAKPGEHKTVQARIIAYAQEIGWTYVPRDEAEARRGFDPDGATAADRARTASPYFRDLLYGKAREFNPRYQGAEGAIVGELQHLTTDIAGNRDCLSYLRNEAKYFDVEAGRELDLLLIDYDDITRPPGERRNVYEVT